MTKRLLVIVLFSLLMLLALVWVVKAKLPAGYSHTRGLYIFWDTPEDGLDPPQLPVVGGFWRYNWAAIEPANSAYDWATIDDWIQREQQHGKLAAIGFSFFNRYSGTGTDRGLQIPPWLPSIDPGVQWRNPRRNPEVWYVPNYWNDTFRYHYRRFIQAFAQHLADNPAIRDRVGWVSIGVGLEGETQPACRWGCPEEEPDWWFYHDNMEITSAQWLEYVNWCTDTYKQAFDNRGLGIPIFLDIGPTYMGERDQFSSHAVSKGVGLRNNGLKMDRENGVIYEPMKRYFNTVPMAWETYGTPGWLDSRAAVYWGLRCGLAKHPDNFTVDRTLVSTEEYLALLQFAARYCGVTVSTTPGAWVALRQTQQPAGEQGNFSLWLMQKDDVPGGHAPAEWNVGQGHGYKFDVPDGNYEVELHFAEVYYNSGGARVFDIKIEDQVVANDFDIWSYAGGKNKAVRRNFTAQVSDGRLDIDFIPETDDEPTIHAIRVSGPGYEKRINCAGKSYTDQATNVWAADREYEEGSFGYWGGGIYTTGAEMIGTNDDYLYQTLRIIAPGSLAAGRFTRRTDQAHSNTRMYFAIDNDYMYSGSFSQAVITVTYCMIGTDKWQLRYDSTSGTDEVATPYGSTNPWVEKDDSKLWKQAVFLLTDARFADGHPGGTDFSIDCMGDGDEFISFVEVSKDVGVGPTTATIQGSVALQRPERPAPDPSWSIPLTVTVCGTPYPVTTNQWGDFTVPGLAPGTCDVVVKNAHTLSNLRRNYTLQTGDNVINMGELKEGDVNNDDTVNSSDFLLLRGSYFKSAGQPGFVNGADFNEDDTVNSTDFLLMRGNYFQSGPIELSAA
jgi:hypothetical protein